MADVRHDDGSAGDANYGAIGTRYTNYRQPEPAIAALIEAALGDADTVLNVGAGAGSYEPTDRKVTRSSHRPRCVRSASSTLAAAIGTHRVYPGRRHRNRDLGLQARQSAQPVDL